MIRNKLKLQTYNDGVVSLHEVSNIAAPGDKTKDGLKLKQILRFEERTVGINRFYSAMQNNIKVDMILRVPRRSGITTQDIAVVNSEQYKIKQIQYPSDIKPLSMDLSLERVVQKYDLG